MNRTIPVSIAFALWSGVAHSDAFTDSVVQQYQDMGFDYIEIKEGPTQVKVEAIMSDGRKVEVIYDRETGQILKQENERAESDEIGRSGVDIDSRDSDFLDDDGDDEDDDDENDQDDENDESDDDEDDEDDEDDDSDESDDDEGDESDDDENDESDDES